MSKDDQESVIVAAAPPATKMLDEIAEVILAPVRHTTTKRKRFEADGDEDAELNEPGPRGQRVKILGAALAGMVVGSVGTVLALANM